MSDTNLDVLIPRHNFQIHEIYFREYGKEQELDHHWKRICKIASRIRPRGKVYLRLLDQKNQRDLPALLTPTIKPKDKYYE